MENVKKQARAQAKEMRKDREVEEIYWFPNKTEVRLVEIIPNTENISPKSKEMTPFYFDESTNDNLAFCSAIVAINKRDFDILSVPKGWCNKDQAVKI